MAKARSRRFRRSRPRQRYDWVYRGPEYGADGSLNTLNGSYMPFGSPVTVSGGAANATSFVLYDSQTYTTQQLQVPAALGMFTSIPRAGRAEGRGAMVKAVQGVLLVRPSAWALGNQLIMNWRILIAEQDGDDGFALLDADYASFSPVVTEPDTDVSIWRNESKCLKEGFVYRQFSDNSALIQVPVYWSGKPRRLGAEHGLFLRVEAATGSSVINPIIVPRLRTLVADES